MKNLSYLEKRAKWAAEKSTCKPIINTVDPTKLNLARKIIKLLADSAR